MLLPSPFVAVKNPYRSGSQLDRLFRTLQIGIPRTLRELEAFIGGYSQHLLSLPMTPVRKCCLKRIASALRTIRNQPNGVDIVYNKTAKTYQMVEALS